MALSSCGTYRRFIVQVPETEGVGDADWRAYIAGAVASMKGCYHPEDPVFDMDGSAVVCSTERVNNRALNTALRQLDTAEQHNEELTERNAELRALLEECLATLAADGPTSALHNKVANALTPITH